jgi:long-chain fatty acid transport protein
MLLRRATRSLLLSTAVLLLPALAGAQGFGLNEIGSCAVGRSFAVTAGGCSDASLVFWNPAAIGRTDGWSALVGGAAISIKGAFTRDTTGKRYDADVPTQFTPHVFITHHTKGSNLSWGAGVYAPYGLTSQWGDSFPGRFNSQVAKLKTLYVQPTLAYQVTSKWSIGGGPIWGHSSVSLDQSIDLSQQIAAAATATTPAVTFAQLGIAKGTEFGKGHLEGSATGFGGQVGIMGEINKDWSVGARYLTKINFKYDNADATFKQVNTGLVLAAALPGIPAGTQVDLLVAPQFTTGKLTSQHVSTAIAHPAQAQIGFNYKGFKDWNIETDYAWTQWSAFKNLAVSFDSAALSSTRIEDYNNSSALRISAQRDFTNKATLRLGISGATTAAPDATVTPLLPEQERAYYTIGGAYPLSTMFSVDGAFAHIATLGRRGRLDERPNRTTGANALNTGVYTLSANIFSLSLKASF